MNVYGKSILVIEDDHDTRVSIRMILETEGFTVFSAAHGREGMEVLIQARPSLIMLDLNMPIVNGWEFLRQVRVEEEFRRVPVVILTASHVRTAPEGAVALFPKPIDVNGLLKVTYSLCCSA